LLKEQGVTDILLIGGGIIPETDLPGLKEKGIAVPCWILAISPNGAGSREEKNLL
jgi:hypothetical protein